MSRGKWDKYQGSRVDFCDPDQLKAGWQSGGIFREVVPALMDEEHELVIVTQDNRKVYIPFYLVEQYVRFLSDTTSSSDQLE